jgi:hypothetical protein
LILGINDLHWQFLCPHFTLTQLQCLHLVLNLGNQQLRILLLRLAVYHFGVDLFLRWSPSRGGCSPGTRWRAISKPDSSLLLFLERLHLRQRDAIINHLPQILPAIRFHNHKITDADILSQVREIKQIRTPGFKFHDVQRPGRRHGMQRYAFAQIGEGGLSGIRGTTLDRLRIVGLLLWVNGSRACGGYRGWKGAARVRRCAVSNIGNAIIVIAANIGALVTVSRVREVLYALAWDKSGSQRLLTRSLLRGACTRIKILGFGVLIVMITWWTTAPTREAALAG